VRFEALVLNVDVSNSSSAVRRIAEYLSEQLNRGG